MRILVTGATGFIGRALVERLAGQEVVALVRPGSRIAGVETVEADLAQPIDADRLPKRVDAVVHLAQSSKARSFPESAPETFTINVAATAALLDWALRAGATRFCLASTGSVYEPYAGPLEEDAALAPTSFYAASKAAAELLLRPYQGRLAASALRLFFPYGPGQSGRLFSELATRIREGRPVHLPPGGDGLVLAPTYVGDVADAIGAAVEEGWTGPLNVAAPGSITLRTLAEAIGRVLETRVHFATDPHAGAAHIVPNLARLATLRDPTAFVPLETGLRRTFSP
jgi:nucleoside-diphosphate-sugar epimerase